MPIASREVGRNFQLYDLRPEQISTMYDLLPGKNCGLQQVWKVAVFIQVNDGTENYKSYACRIRIVPNLLKINSCEDFLIFPFSVQQKSR